MKRKLTPRRCARDLLCALFPLEPRLLLSDYHVDVNAPGPAHDGLSWETAFTDIQQILPTAEPGSRILVADGTYKPTQDTDRTKSFILRSGITLEGGYAGASDPSSPRNISVYESILSGDIGTSGEKADNSYHVVVGSNTDATAILDGLTITGGNADAIGTSDGIGGGVYNDQGSPTLTNLKFIGNSARIGGAINNYNSSSPRISNCRFIGNSALNEGGAMYNYYRSSPLILASTFTGNVGTTGGAVYDSTEATPRYVNSIFSTNRAVSGGAIYMYSSASPSFINCTIAGNFATASGAGIYDNATTRAAFTNSIVWGNQALIDAQISPNPPGLTITYSDVQGGAPGPGNVNVDPQFLRAPSPGPDSEWGTADDDPGDLRLQACSPVADAGDNDALAETTIDFAGQPRFQDIPTTADTGVGTAPILDMGAYEAAPALSASAGGPYVIVQGQTLTLSGYGASVNPGQLQYAWEWTGDDEFDDASGASPTFNTAGLPASIQTIRLRVTDSSQQIIEAASTIRILSPVLYVDDSAAPGGDGSSWAKAFNDLQTVLRLSLPGNEIRVAGGTYKPSATANPSMAFQLGNGIRLIGRYAGLGAADPDSRDPALHPSILSGEIGDPASKSDNSVYVVVSANVDATTILDGFTISGSGNAGMYLVSSSPIVRNSIFTANAGAGLDNRNSSSPSVSNSIFTGNSTGMSNRYSSSPSVIDSTFADNTSVGMSNYMASSPSITNTTFSRNLNGGISNSSGANLTITRCTFNDNQTSSFSSSGGAIYNSSSNPTITDSTFTNNSSKGDGGAIYNVKSSPIISNSTFSGNSAANHGGAIYNSQSSPTIADSTFTSNRALNRNGGAIDNSNSSSPTISRSTFVTNSAFDSGGAIHNYSMSSPTITDSTFAGNTAKYGGAIDTFEGAQPKVINSSFTNNQASEMGGALYNTMQSSMSIAGSTFTGNSANGSSSGLGGAIYYLQSLSPLVITDSTFTANTAKGDGGAIYTASLVLTGCTFTRNTGRYGGALNTSGSLTVRNSVFNGNSALLGGAIHNKGAANSTLKLVSSSFAGNLAHISGGALYSTDSPSSQVLDSTFADNNATSGDGKTILSVTPLTLSNSILWTSAVNYSPLTIPAASIVSNNDIKYYRGGTANIDKDPLFVRNPSAGPDAKWGTADDDYGDLRLKPASPCIDVGSNDAVPSDVITDLAGNPRIIDTFSVNDPDPIVDMGAFEHTPAPATIPGADTLDEYTLKFTAGQSLIQVWTNRYGTGTPAYTFDSRALSSLNFASGGGSDGIYISLSGATFPVPLILDGDSIALYPGLIPTAFAALTVSHAAGLPRFGLRELSIGQLNLAPGARLDLGYSSLVIRNGDYAQALQCVTSARNGSPRWTGPGVGTSVANADQGFAIQQIGPDVKIKFTWNGDLNLDGRINADDYFAIDEGFLNKPANPTYQNGDFNFDGKIDADDYFLIDQAFLNQKGTILSAQKPVAPLSASVVRPAIARKSRTGLFSDRLVARVWK